MAFAAIRARLAATTTLGPFAAATVAIQSYRTPREQHKVRQVQCAATLKPSLVSDVFRVMDFLLFDDFDEDRRLYVLPDDEEESLRRVGGEDADVYGELRLDAIEALLSELRLDSSDEVWDLGSGIGKICLQVRLRSDAGHVVGVELSGTRHEEALRLRHLLEPFLRHRGKLPDLRHGNVLAAELDLSCCTVAIFNCRLFGPAATEQMCVKFREHAPQLRAIVATGPLILGEAWACIQVQLCTSWGMADGLVYTRNV